MANGSIGEGKWRFVRRLRRSLTSPVSNFTQKLSAWAGIVTGVVSLIISIVALRLSNQQMQDHAQLDKLTQLYELSKSEVDLKSKSDAAILDGVLKRIFYNIINANDIYKEDLLGDTLELREMSSLEKFCSIARENKELLNDNRLNTIILSNERIRRVWTGYMDSQNSFINEYFTLQISGVVSFPFMDKSIDDRRRILEVFQKSSLEFFNTTKDLTKSFPLNNYAEKTLNLAYDDSN